MAIPCKIDPAGEFDALLPRGFVRVEYLESKGSNAPYIITDIPSDTIYNATSPYVRVDFQADGNFWFGYYSSGYRAFQTFGWLSIPGTVVTDLNHTDRHSFSLIGSDVYVDDVMRSTNQRYNLNTNAAIYLFARHRYDINSTSTATTSTKIFIFEANTTKGKVVMVPCWDKIKQEGSMVDLYTKKAYYNANPAGGAFSVGPVVSSIPSPPLSLTDLLSSYSSYVVERRAA